MPGSGIRELLKKVVRAAARALFDRRSALNAMGIPCHIVVLRWDAKLGDAIVSSPFYREIRNGPRTRVTVVTVPALAQMHARNFGADSVIVSTERPGLAELQRIRRQLGRVDVVVHLVGRVRPIEIAFLSWLNPCQIHSMDDSLRLVTHKLGRSTSDLLFADKYLHVLKSLGVPVLRKEYIVPLPSPDEMFSVDSADIVVNPYGSRSDKSLSDAKARELLQTLVDAFPNHSIGILNSGKTRQNAQLLERSLGNPNVRALERIDKPEHAAAAVDGSLVVVTVDTAVVHMAVGLRKKVVAVYAYIGSETNPWLPPASPLTRVVISRQDVMRYRLTSVKDMDQFDSLEVVHAIRALSNDSESLSLPPDRSSTRCQDRCAKTASPAGSAPLKTPSP